MAAPGPRAGPWWLPNAVVMAGGLAMVLLGVLDHDNQALLLVGASAFSGAAGHAIGVQQPQP